VSTSTRTTAALVVIVAFIAGFFVGIAGDRLYLIHTRQFFPRRAADYAAHHVVSRLDRELHLTDAQKTSIQRVVDQHRVRIEAVWNNVRPQVRQEIEAANAEIDRLLTPEQRTKFQQMRMRMAPRRGGHREGPLPRF